MIIPGRRWPSIYRFQHDCRDALFFFSFCQGCTIFFCNVGVNLYISEYKENANLDHLCAHTPVGYIIHLLREFYIDLTYGNPNIARISLLAAFLQKAIVSLCVFISVSITLMIWDKVSIACNNSACICARQICQTKWTQSIIRTGNKEDTNVKDQIFRNT